MAVLAAAATVPLAAYLLERLANGPNVEMNASRVANAIALARGYHIMPGADDGPLLDFMYGPMFVVAYTPAALAPTPSAAIWTGILLTVAFVFTPIAWFAFRGPNPLPRPLAFAAVVAFGLFCTWDRGLTWAAWYILADGPALVLAGLACAFVSGRHASPSTRSMLVASACAALAVWSKQTLAPIVIALPLYVWLVNDGRTALRFTIVLGVVGLLVSSIFVIWFGIEGILFNMFLMPGGHPWKGSLTGQSRLHDLLVSARRFAETAWPATALVAAVSAASWRRESGVRSWLRSNPWTCFVLLALLLVPFSLMAGAKIGGEHNVYGICTYFLTAAAMLGLARCVAAADTRRSTLAAATMLAILAFGTGRELLAPGRAERLHTTVTQLRNWRSNPQEAGTAFARAHPDEAHFIGNPLIGLYSDGKLYSDMFGRYDRDLAGYTPDPSLMHAYSPKNLRYVVVRRNFPWFAKPSVFPEYTDFTKLVPVESLPDHFVWVRPDSAAKSIAERGK